MLPVIFSERSPIIISTAKIVRYAARTITIPAHAPHIAESTSIMQAARAAGIVNAFFLTVINATRAARTTLDAIAVIFIVTSYSQKEGGQEHYSYSYREIVEPEADKLKHGGCKTYDYHLVGFKPEGDEQREDEDSYN